MHNMDGLGEERQEQRADQPALQTAELSAAARGNPDQDNVSDAEATGQEIGKWDIH
jgi:hypothetical protein